MPRTRMRAVMKYRYVYMVLGSIALSVLHFFLVPEGFTYTLIVEVPILLVVAFIILDKVLTKK